MKSDRLLSTLLLLQAHGRMTGRELSEKLEVSQRTIHRDMEALSAAGVPIYALRGAAGGWQLDEGWRTQVPGLDEAELRAFLMAQPRTAGDTRLAAAAESALNKLMAAMPTTLRERAISIRQRIHVDTTGWRGTTEDLSLLPTVQDAVARDLKLSIRYARTRRDSVEAIPNTNEKISETVERIVSPLGLVAKGSTWYLVALSNGEFRTYRISRIRDAKILDEPSERPADFDLAAHWKSSTQQFKEGWPKFEATLCFHPNAAQEMKIWRLASPVKPDEKLPNTPEGWITLQVQFDSEEQARFVTLGLGPHVEVLQPTSLRASHAADVAAMFERIHRTTANQL